MNYKQLYRKHFGYLNDEYVPCEMCGGTAVDVHHVKYKSCGGKDEIENLVGLCRTCHNRAHFKEEPYLEREDLLTVHKEILTRIKK